MSDSRDSPIPVGSYGQPIIRELDTTIADSSWQFEDVGIPESLSRGLASAINGVNHVVMRELASLRERVDNPTVSVTCLSSNLKVLTSAVTVWYYLLLILIHQLIYRMFKRISPRLSVWLPTKLISILSTVRSKLECGIRIVPGFVQPHYIGL